MSKLLGQFAGILIFLSIGFTLSSVGFNRQKMPAETALIFAWNHEHTLIATTLLVVGLFAVLSWDSTFPDRRDVMVLAPLPVRARTLFFAKVAALGSALSLTVVALNALTGITWPFALASADGGLAFSLDILRSLFAYWVTMLAAGAFIFGSVLTLQGLSAQLPRPIFLRLSALLQMAAFGLFVSVYFLEPSLATPEKLSNPSSENLLAMLPSYWFLGLFERLNGSTNPAMVAQLRGPGWGWR